MTADLMGPGQDHRHVGIIYIYIYTQIEIITNLFLTSRHMTSSWVWEVWHSIKTHIS